MRNYKKIADCNIFDLYRVDLYKHKKRDYYKVVTTGKYGQKHGNSASTREDAFKFFKTIAKNFVLTIDAKESNWYTSYQIHAKNKYGWNNKFFIYGNEKDKKVIDSLVDYLDIIYSETSILENEGVKITKHS